MKCIFCEKPILPWHKYCTHCGQVQHGRMFAEERRFAIERYKRLTKEFDFSKETVAKIENINNILFAKMERLFKMALEIRGFFVHLQKSGLNDFYEFTISGKVSVCDLFMDKTTPIIGDSETAEKLWDSVDSKGIPNCKFEIDYNFGWLDEYSSKQEWLCEVPHTGIFANHAFDGMKICRAMDVIFNRQKTYTLQDALYMNAEDFSVDFNVTVAKKLWQPDKKLFNSRYFGIRCPSCGKLILPFRLYCPNCGDDIFFQCKNLKSKSAAEKISRRRYNKKQRNFDWNYINKMKVYEITDYTTELIYHLYDQAFVLQKKIDEARANPDSEFRNFPFYSIDGGLKYLNDDATPNASKKTAHLLREITNADKSLPGLYNIEKVSVWNENDRLELPLLCGENVNVEYFDSAFVGNHTINYFIHRIFCDGNTYTMQDLLYMKAEDWGVQYEIYFSDVEAEYE